MTELVHEASSLLNVHSLNVLICRRVFSVSVLASNTIYGGCAILSGDTLFSNATASSGKVFCDSLSRKTIKSGKIKGVNYIGVVNQAKIINTYVSQPIVVRGVNYDFMISRVRVYVIVTLRVDSQYGVSTVECAARVRLAISTTNVSRIYGNVGEKSLFYLVSRTSRGLLTRCMNVRRGITILYVTIIILGKRGALLAIRIRSITIRVILLNVVGKVVGRNRVYAKFSVNVSRLKVINNMSRMVQDSGGVQVVGYFSTLRVKMMIISVNIVSVISSKVL